MKPKTKHYNKICEEDYYHLNFRNILTIPVPKGLKSWAVIDSTPQSICIEPTCPISEPAHLEKLIIKIVTELAGFKTPDAS